MNEQHERNSGFGRHHWSENFVVYGIELESFRVDDANE